MPIARRYRGQRLDQDVQPLKGKHVADKKNMQGAGASRPCGNLFSRDGLREVVAARRGHDAGTPPPGLFFDGLAGRLTVKDEAVNGREIPLFRATVQPLLPSRIRLAT